ncbi:MAG: 5-formyltetrahydrofolate cyclo-ligase [Lawsonibacter sp.]|nr:5-formyltetrahydrofolate cyclo-ligase [Lawsonibacter sp.]
MASAAAAEKTALRVRLRRILNEMPTARMQSSDQALFRQLMGLSQIQTARVISLFWGITGLEPDTRALVEQLLALDKTVCLPRIVADHGMELRQYTPGCPMDMNSFGIWEPTLDCPLIAREEIDLVIVPALCYDRRGFRLGYGGGYFDRWLSGYQGVTVGMCRQAVLQDAVPVEGHDKPVQAVVTEEQVLLFPEE